MVENYLTQPIQWIENEVYYGKNYNKYLFKPYREKGGYKDLLEIDANKWRQENSYDFQWEDYSIRLATPEEKQWFLACEKAGKFVPKPEYSSLEQIIIW